MAKKAKASNTLAKLKAEITRWLRHRSELGFDIVREENQVKISVGLAHSCPQNPVLSSAQVAEIRDFLQMIKQKFCLIVHKFVSTGMQLQLSCSLA